MVWGSGRPGSLETENLVPLVAGKRELGKQWEESFLDKDGYMDDMATDGEITYYVHLLVLTFLLTFLGFF